MQQLSSYEKLKPVFYAVILVGLALLLIGFYRFISLSQAIPENFAYKYHQQNTSVQQIDEATARILMSADLDLRDLERQRNEAVIAVGTGVILTAAGWLANDMFRSRSQKRVALSS